MEKNEDDEMQSSEQGDWQTSKKSSLLEKEKNTTLKNLNESIALEKKLMAEQGVLSE